MHFVICFSYLFCYMLYCPVICHIVYTLSVYYRHQKSVIENREHSIIQLLLVFVVHRQIMITILYIIII